MYIFDSVFSSFKFYNSNLLTLTFSEAKIAPIILCSVFLVITNLQPKGKSNLRNVKDFPTSVYKLHAWSSSYFVEVLLIVSLSYSSPILSNLFHPLIWLHLAVYICCRCKVLPRHCHTSAWVLCPDKMHQSFNWQASRELGCQNFWKRTPTCSRCIWVI